MPVAAKDVTEEKSPYSVNKALFEEATSIKGQLKLVETRLAKMEEHRAEVSDSVYFKVKTDYETQIDGVRSSFDEKCKDIENELRQLYQAQAQQEEQLAKHQEILEEAKFRHMLGEYNEKKFKEAESKQNKEIQSFTEVVNLIKGSIKQYEEVLGHPFDEASVPARPKPEKPQKIEPLPAPIENKAREEAKSAPGKAPAAKHPLEEDTLKTAAPSGPPAKEPVQAPPPAPLPTAGSGSSNYEEKLGDELDMFLGSEGDYFNQENESILNDSVVLEDEAPPMMSTKTAHAPAPAAKTPEPKGLDDSLSSILKDIPMEDEPSEVSISTTSNSESTGAHIGISPLPGEASLLLIEGDLDDPEVILSENTTIGRSPSNDIVLKESKVSRQHATIHMRNGDYVLVDLKSSNGVFVNGKKVEEAVLKDGDEVSVGSYKFQFNLV